jgi:hypothetical protein
MFSYQVDGIAENLTWEVFKATLLEQAEQGELDDANSTLYASS